VASSVGRRYWSSGRRAGSWSGKMRSRPLCGETQPCASGVAGEGFGARACSRCLARLRTRAALNGRLTTSGHQTPIVGWTCAVLADLAVCGRAQSAKLGASGRLVGAGAGRGLTHVAACATPPAPALPAGDELVPRGDNQRRLAGAHHLRVERPPPPRSERIAVCCAGFDSSAIAATTAPSALKVYHLRANVCAAACAPSRRRAGMAGRCRSFAGRYRWCPRLTVSVTRARGASTVPRGGL
jgi:hypothetical protein